ncbi:hypothetical protein LLG95_17010 [bacterium]|nr:hypothetical protein [bacterium]
MAAFALWIHSPKISNSILAGMCLIAALLAKESAIVVPVFLFAFELIVAGRGTHGKRVGHALRRTWPLFLILIIFMVIRAMALGHAVGGYGSERILGIHPLFWARNLAAATFRSFMPIIPHSFDWPDWIPFFLIAISLPICVIYLILRHLRQSDASPQSLVPRLIVFCSLAFVVSVVPVLNLPLSIRNSEGERFIYLPTVFTSIMLAVFLASTFQRKYSFILTGILLYFMALELSFATWGMAGRLSGNLVGDLRTIVDSRTVERLDVYNLPDHLRGAYVFRNGFVKAARLNGITPERIKEIKIQNVQPIQNVNEKFENPTLTASPGTISINYSEGKLKEISR